MTYANKSACGLSSTELLSFVLGVTNGVIRIGSFGEALGTNLGVTLCLDSVVRGFERDISLLGVTVFELYNGVVLDKSQAHLLLYKKRGKYIADL